ncbi:TetR family transcriptional regulator [Actinoalloteichus hymeniacidonis]|uniref:Transcriptional regulator, TetR family n=1 Tax=Actinoalloteichus hymeniacidonis TaxID=340345 RepID=A0AAC9HMJ9_9PSEU|nr:TetR family transcriptional regulator [Actinoalloteichus hymeniacidonis]AOS62082.1 transcriptional regulator, TetR family [Actinoalloteichus hymeniacidonis]MBB5909896.1 AcrR family transcriptional regulator [Actinoalloteichus hymeniacidonis]
MTGADVENPGLRERTRRAVQAEIAASAMRLFIEQGFDNTTIDQIAAEVGISRRSCFRYFASKEDMVLGSLNETGLKVQTALAARPADETPWPALRSAFETMLADPYYTLQVSLEISRMLHEVPSLRARKLEKQLRWMELLVPDIARRLRACGAEGDLDVQAKAIVASALSCVDVAVEAWIASEGAETVEDLYDEAVRAVRGTG